MGRATAVAFARRGFDVALLARGKADLEGAAEEVEATGRRASCVATDVAHFEEVDQAAEAAKDGLGPIDVWVKDAMTTAFAPLDEVGPSDFQRASK